MARDSAFTISASRTRPRVVMWSLARPDAIAWNHGRSRIAIAFATKTCAVERRETYPVNSPNGDRKSTRLNSSHDQISYAVFCLKKKNHRIPLVVSCILLYHEH